MSRHPYRRRTPVIVTGSEYPAGLALLRGVHIGGDAAIAAVTRADAMGAVSRSAHAVEIVPDPVRERRRSRGTSVRSPGTTVRQCCPVPSPR